MASAGHLGKTAASLVDLLRSRAEREQPETAAYTFLAGTGESGLSYRELDERARAIGAALSRRCARGDRVLLLLPPGLDYVASFFGCLYAGVIAVPVYPPGGPGLARSLARIESIVADAGPTTAVTLAALASAESMLPGLNWVFADAPEAGAEDWRPLSTDRDAIAFLQYTSGSTATPKGVMVSHGNLLHNGADIERFFGLTPDSKTVIWLPPYHDMGLIGGILQPLYTGHPTVLMSPTDFVQQPLRWLRAIAEHRACTSGGPNFAYELCLRKIEPAQLAGLDLSRWTLAFNGAEPIRADVMERFAELLAPTGFRYSSFYPCYGLAEGTLIVSGGRPGALPVLRARESAPPLVGSGHGSPDQHVLVVDPRRHTVCPEGEVGEVWVSGPSVAKGYWGRAEDTEDTFNARIAGAGPDGPFLRTGDLGLLDGDELFITGRIKDLIILRGVNHYPQDIEATAAQAHPALQPNGGAAFTITVDGDERLVVTHELARGQEAADPAEVIAAVRAAVSREHLLSVHAIALVAPRGLPRTSSGKIQRHAARAHYLAGELDLVGDEVAAAGDRPAAADDRVRRVADTLRRSVAAKVGSTPERIDLGRTGFDLGLDSLLFLELQHELETELGVQLDPETFYGSTFAAIAEQLAAAMDRPEPATVDEVEAAEDADGLSHGQRGLWYLDRMTACGAAYNLSGAVRLPAAVDTARLRRAVRELAGRHAAMRTVLSDDDGRPRALVVDPERIELEQAVQDGPHALAEFAEEPIDLATGPLLRVRLWTGEDRPVLQVVAHHVVSDFWSLALSLNELVLLYQGRGDELPAPGEYRDFVRWQRRYLDSAEGRAAGGYWRDRLGGSLPVLELPTDRPRPPVQSFRGDTSGFRLDAELTERLRELARSAGTSLYTVLMSAYQVLLHRYTGQDDILVGSPTSGRGRSAFAGVIGYLVNPVVVRGDLSGAPSFREVVDRTGRVVAEALAHQDYPFGLVAEQVQPARDPARSPVFQTMFLFQQAQPGAPTALGALAAGYAGAAFELGGMSLEPLPVHSRTAQFDLTMAVAEHDGLVGSVQYNADLFDADTISRLTANFQALLRELASDPEQSIATVPLLSSDERHLLLDEWNATGRETAGPPGVHQVIAEVAAARPDAVAVTCGSTELTYRELDERAGRVARALVESGAGPEVPVGLCVDRSPELVIGLLAVLKAGAAYVPLDPEYPAARLDAVLDDSGVGVLLTRGRLIDRVAVGERTVLDIDAVTAGPTLSRPVRPDNAAYLLYTSGSTGAPKGVVVSHGNVLNFFAAMDDRVGCGPDDTMLAVTGIAFDISVLELLWTLARGARVVLVPDHALGRARRTTGPRGHMDFSLFYFASAARAATADKYRLVLEGAKFADRNGFSAVWTPERHFHEFGGLYPNPAVLSAALATITERVRLRAGSVVLPLHSPIRIAEEWSLVDNLSGGRVDIAFASGWHADDFVFFPEHYADRKEITFDGVETVRALWRGERVRAVGGSGTEVDVRVFPAPVQPELPVWITAAGTPETFARAGETGANVLTHLLGQSVDQVAANIRRYREARAAAGHAGPGTVALMLHTYIGHDRDEVRELVRGPFTDYLRSSVGLIENLVKSLSLPLDLATMSRSDMDDLLAFAFDRYFDSSALFGTVDSASAMIDGLTAAGVDEIACLVDFGLPDDTVLAGLPELAKVLARAQRPSPETGQSLAELVHHHRPTLLQSTPSMMRLLLGDDEVVAGLRSLRTLLVGGEALTPALAAELREVLPARLVNMYGPTETTVWSTTHEVAEADGVVPIGTPIANTEVYVLDSALEPVPVGVPGELYVGGLGVSRGYWRMPAATAERFLPDPFGRRPGGRLYRTGDRARHRMDGTVEFLGRADRQIKLRGLRVEPGEVEAALERLPEIAEAAVLAREVAPGDRRLIAYVVAAAGSTPTADRLRRALGELLPAAVVPSTFVVLPAFPLTANGKVDVKALPEPAWTGAGGPAPTPPSTELERRIAAIWAEVLRTPTVGSYDNFFDLGGHSLLMVQVHERLKTVVTTELPLIALLEHPTVSALAAHLGRAEGATTSFRDSEDRARRQRASRRSRRSTGERSGR